MLLGAKYHLSQFLPFHLVQLLRDAVEDGEATWWDRLLGRTLVHHVGHHVPAHWSYATNHLLLPEHAVSLIHLLLWTHASVTLWRHWLAKAVLLLALVLHHEVLMLNVVWRLPVLSSSLRLGLLEGTLGLALPVRHLVRLRALVAILIILVVYHKDRIVSLLVRGRGVLSLLLLLLRAIARGDIHDLLATALQATVIHLFLVFLFIVHLLVIVLVVHLAALIILLLFLLVHINVRVEWLTIILFVIVWKRIAGNLLGIALIAGLHDHLLDLLIHQFILQLRVDPAFRLTRCDPDGGRPLNLGGLRLGGPSPVARRPWLV